MIFLKWKAEESQDEKEHLKTKNVIWIIVLYIWKLKWTKKLKPKFFEKNIIRKRIIHLFSLLGWFYKYTRVSLSDIKREVENCLFFSCSYKNRHNFIKISQPTKSQPWHAYVTSNIKHVKMAATRKCLLLKFNISTFPFSLKLS